MRNEDTNITTMLVKILYIFDNTQIPNLVTAEIGQI